MTRSHTSLLGLATLALLGLACASPSLAGPVIELEANGTSANNTLATAQGIQFTAFTPNVDPNVFGTLPTATISGLGGGTDVDFYSFQTGVGTGYFDIDENPSTFDSLLALFNSSGTLIAFDDDTAPDPGSASQIDAFLGTYTFTSAGTYYIAVTQFGNSPNALQTAVAAGALTRPDGSPTGGLSLSGARPGDSSFALNGPQTNGGAYRLNISLSNPAGTAPAAVPEPSQTAAFGLGLLGLAGLIVTAKKRKASITG